MFIGQAVRARMPADAFRRWFLIAMILLGLYLAGNALVRLHARLFDGPSNANRYPLRSNRP